MQKMTHEKTWSFILTPFFPKFTLIMKLTSPIVSWTQGKSSVCHQCSPGTFMWISFLLYKLKGQFHFAPDQHLDWDEGGGSEGGGCFLFASMLHLMGKNPWLSSRGTQVRTSFFHRGLQRPVCQNTITSRNSLLPPVDQTAFTFWWLSQKMMLTMGHRKHLCWAILISASQLSFISTV